MVKTKDRKRFYQRLFGSGQVAKFEANILGGDVPQFKFVGPTEEYRADKIEFETSMINKWFN